MSLLFQRRRIARAVLGELTPAAEARLYAHLRGCAACRAHYDQLAGVKALLDGSAVASTRARARLAAALDDDQGTADGRDHRRPFVWRVALGVLAPAAVVAVWMAKPHAPPRLREEVTLRGRADPAAPQGTPTLVLYASRKTGPAGHGPLRLAGELPGSGEVRVSMADYLQLAVRRVQAPVHIRVAGIDERGRVHDYLSDTLAAPVAGAVTVGRSLELGRDHAPGRVRIVALFSAEPIGERAIADALAGRGSERDVRGALVIEP